LHIRRREKPLNEHENIEAAGAVHFAPGQATTATQSYRATDRGVPLVAGPACSEQRWGCRMKNEMKNELPVLDIEYWDYDDGTVGARLSAQPDGEMWGRTMQTLVDALHWLALEVFKVEDQRKSLNSRMAMLDLGMQATWIDGRYTVRFLSRPGFGVSFSKEKYLAHWLKEWVNIALQAKPPTQD
jgi:hypothetical protein